MGAPRKPTNILELSGAYRKNPSRRNARRNEPIPIPGIGDPPADFLRSDSPTSIALLAIWDEMIQTCAPDVLTRMDRFALETLCRLKRKERTSSIKGGEIGALNNLYAKFGMTPSDRSKAAVATEKHGDELTDFLRKANG
jgi:hypothetical protein